MIDNRAYKLLKHIYKKGRLTLSEISQITGVDEAKQPSSITSALKREKFISTWDTDKVIDELGDCEWGGYAITLEGRAYVEKRRRETRNFWVPYSITTLIALLSLVTSLAEHWGTIMSWFAS